MFGGRAPPTGGGGPPPAAGYGRPPPISGSYYHQEEVPPNAGSYHHNPYGGEPPPPVHGHYGGHYGGGDPAPPAALTTFRKNFYLESSSVASMTMEEAERLRHSMEIALTRGPQEIKPVPRFEDAAFPKDIEEELYGAGFKGPSPIQAQAWPILLSGHDFIGIAETGSGKTLAFLLPAVVHIMDQPPVKRGEGPIALVMAPTRELVEQIKTETNRFASRLRNGVAYGGASRKGQLRSIRDGLDILVACPGRLIDFMERSEIYLTRVTYLVLDEADRMLDMGFEPQIRTVVRSIRDDRQTVMFSATWPVEVERLARDLCSNGELVEVRIGSTGLKANNNVQQEVIVLESEREKCDKMIQLLKELHTKNASQRILIFTETKRGCDILSRQLREATGTDALCIHGDKEQRERTYVLDEFRSGRHPILVATDVASRGLDIKDVKCVINYDMPNQIEDYVHRIGRTGRAGATGTSYTFITQDKPRLANDLVRILLEAKQEIPPLLNDLAMRTRKQSGPPRRYGGAPGGGYRGRGTGAGPPGGGGSRPYSRPSNYGSNAPTAYGGGAPRYYNNPSTSYATGGQMVAGANNPYGGGYSSSSYQR